MIKQLISIVKVKAPYRVIHPCSMIFPSNGNTIGHVNPVHLKDSMKNPADLDLLYTCRALSGSILTSGRNVRLEEDWNPSIYVPRQCVTSSIPADDRTNYPYVSLRQQVWGETCPPLQTFILTQEGFPSRVSELPQKEQDQISIVRATNLAMALENSFDNIQRPELVSKEFINTNNCDMIVCLEVGPSTWVDLYTRANEPSFSRFNVVLALSSFHFTRDVDKLFESLAVIQPKLNLQELVYQRGLKKVFEHQEPKVDGVTFKMSLFA